MNSPCLAGSFSSKSGPAATASDCRLIVSWNFSHIVSFQKIPLYNGVNLSRGFGAIAIHSPQEVIEHEDQDV